MGSPDKRVDGPIGQLVVVDRPITESQIRRQALPIRRDGLVDGLPEPLDGARLVPPPGSTHCPPAIGSAHLQLPGNAGRVPQVYY